MKFVNNNKIMIGQINNVSRGKTGFICYRKLVTQNYITINSTKE